MPKDGDCNDCKRSPTTASGRGVVGKGRYARELEAKRKRAGTVLSIYSEPEETTSPPRSVMQRSELISPRSTISYREIDSPRRLDSGYSSSDSSSPWIDEERDPWERKPSGIRREQDLEWEMEHERRLNELDRHKRLVVQYTLEERERRSMLREALRHEEEKSQRESLRKWEHNERERIALRRDREWGARSGSGYSGSRRSGSGSQESFNYEDDLGLWRGRNMAYEIRDRWRH